MKKTIYSIAALCLGFFASCSEDMFENRFQQGNEITFAFEELTSRATPINDKAALLGAFDNYDVVAYNGATKVFSDVLDENLVAQDKHYWPETATNYDFFVMPQPTDAYDFTLENVSANGSYKFNYQAPTPDGETDGVAAADLVMAHAQASSGQVGLTFEHLLAGVRFVYANPLVAHHVQYVGVQNATMKGQIAYSNGSFSWTSQDGSGNLYQAVNADIMKSGEQMHDDNAHFMLIPGGSGNVTFSVIMDNDQAYNLEYAKSDLEAGKILTINIGDPSSQQEAVEGISATKEYTKNDDGTYTLRIETYVTGEQKIVVTSSPADIAVLVDVSGSMAWGMDFNYEKQQSKEYSGEWNLFPQGESNDAALYFLDNDRNYYEVKMFDVAGGVLGAGRRYWMYYEKEGVRYYLTGSNAEGIAAKNYTNPTFNDYPEKMDGSGKINPGTTFSPQIWTGVLYKKVSNSNKTTRLAATKAALKEFVDNVFADGKRNNVTHKVSIVTFSGSSSVSVDWTELNNDASVTTLKSKIDGISASGATRADLGMGSVKSQFDKNTVKNDNASKVVVMLTDGDPTQNSGFSATVANTTISTAKELKGNNYNATVWSVYVGDTPSAQSYDYMQRVSSNSSAATTYQDGTVEDKGYYVYAGDSEALKNVFSTISSTSGGATQTMDENTVLSDVISPVFDLSGVNVDKMNIYYIEQGSDNPIPAGDEIEPNLTNSTITVQGFDYSKYFWGTHQDGIKGRKLVIELTLTPKAGLDPGTYFTNGAGSGLYVGGTLVSPFTNATEGKDPTDPNTIDIVKKTNP